MEKLFSLFYPSDILLVIYRSLQKLNPFKLYRNPIIFITEIGAILTFIQFFFAESEESHFSLHVSIWLWVIVIFANIAEAFAEIRSEAKTDLLRKARSATLANFYDPDGNLNVVSYKDLKKGNLILVRKEETIPADGEIISGAAAIDESAMTGKPQTIIRRALSETRNVIAGTKVISDEIVVKVTANPGEGFIDKMIELVESTKRTKTHNELALTILLSNMCIIFLTMVIAFQFFGYYYNVHLDITMQIALLACLIPTTIGGLFNAITIAGINRLMKKNVIAKNRQAVEAAGNIDLILLDKTGTSQLQDFKLLGIKTVIMTEDNALTASTIAKKIHADGFLAPLSPEEKLHYLKQEQLEGHVIALAGNGLNDIPALAQADLGLAMNKDIQAAKEAANMIDLDSNPNKLFEIIEIGKQLLMTRGALTALSLGNDISKYFVLLPTLLIPVFPEFKELNFLHLSSPKNTVISAVIFNALTLIILIPLSFKGVKLIPDKVNIVLKKHLLIYGVGGIILPFLGIKLIDMLLTGQTM